MGTNKHSKPKRTTTVKKTVKKSKKQASPKRRIHIGLTFAVYAFLIGISGATAAAMAVKQHVQTLPDPFSQVQRTTTTFRLYYPARLPAGYQINPASMDHAQLDIVNFSLSASSTKVINITEQTVPADFNYHTFYGTFGDKTEVKTSLGTATVGTIDAGKTRLASLVTPDKTWILMSMDKSIPLSDLQYVLTHFKLSM